MKYLVISTKPFLTTDGRWVIVPYESEVGEATKHAEREEGAVWILANGVCVAYASYNRREHKGYNEKPNSHWKSLISDFDSDWLRLAHELGI